MYRLLSRNWPLALSLVCAWYAVSSCLLPSWVLLSAPQAEVPANEVGELSPWFDRLAIPAQATHGALDLVQNDRLQPLAVARPPADLSYAWHESVAVSAQRLFAPPSLIAQHVRLQI